ncbi:MAG: alpha/beta fold hydrolase [Deltaproteobacteria bacterium]|nr:alpha/beta fold hydrolase [Deltaproteobacteria bacterium]
MTTRACLLHVCALAMAAVTLACATAPAPRVAREGERMLVVNGAELRVHEEGAGDELPVLFVHGYGSRLEAWRAVQPALAQGRRTVSYDQRGFGLSERTEGGYGPHGHAADLVALLDALHIERAVLVAHSYGAGVALSAALAAPERVAGVVLVSPFALDEQLASSLRWAKLPLVGEYLYATSFRGFAGEKYQLAFADGGRFATLSALDEVEAIQAIPQSDAAALATVRAMDYRELAARYRSIAAPLRVLWGEADRVTPIRMLPTFAEQLPQARFVRLPGVGHMPSWEAPALVVEQVQQVLAEVAPGAGGGP